MPRRALSRSRIAGVVAGRRLAREAVAELGHAIQAARQRRRWSQRQLGEKVGLSAWRIGQIERGQGIGASCQTWFALSHTLAIPLRIEFGRDASQEPADAGHLKLQELSLRLAREIRCSRTFELATRPSEPALSVDVGWRDDHRRVLILNECWNTFGNVNVSLRSTRRKIVEAEQLAAAMGGEAGAYRVAACWLVRDTRRNRDLIARYPDVFASAFPASSPVWVRALTASNAPVPDELGLVWTDLKATRVFAWRKPRLSASAHGSVPT